MFSRVSKPATFSGKKRKENEDFFYFEESLGLYMVCDGMTHINGKWASKKAVEIIRGEILSLKEQILTYNRAPSLAGRNKVKSLLKKSLQISLEKYQRVSLEEQKVGAMVSIDILLVLTDTALLIHVGKTKTFSILNGKSIPLTVDHTEYELILSSGALEKVNPIYKKHLLKSFGQSNYVDFVVESVPIQPGMLFLLSTSGFSSALNTDERSLLKESLSIVLNVEFERLSKSLVEFAAKMETEVNTTVMVIKIESLDDSRSDKVSIENRNQILSALNEALLFSEISKDRGFIEKLVAISTICKFKPEQPLLLQGDRSEYLMLIMKGECRVVVNALPVNSIQLGRYDVLGDFEYFTNDSNQGSILAKTEVTAIRLEKTQLKELFRNNYGMSEKFHSGLAREIKRKIHSLTEREIGLA